MSVTSQRTPHTYARRTITLPPEIDALLLELARAHRGNVSAAVAELVREAHKRQQT